MASSASVLENAAREPKMNACFQQNNLLAVVLMLIIIFILPVYFYFKAIVFVCLRSVAQALSI